MLKTKLFLILFSVDKDNNVFIYEYHNCVVKRIDAATGFISTIAGTSGTCGHGLESGPAHKIALRQNIIDQLGLAVDEKGAAVIDYNIATIPFELMFFPFILFFLSFLGHVFLPDALQGAVRRLTLVHHPAVSTKVLDKTGKV